MNANNNAAAAAAPGQGAPPGGFDAFHCHNPQCGRARNTLRAQIAHRDVHIQRMEPQLQSKNAEIRRLNQEIRMHQDEIRGLQEKLAARGTRHERASVNRVLCLWSNQRLIMAFFTDMA